MQKAGVGLKWGGEGGGERERERERERLCTHLHLTSQDFSGTYSDPSAMLIAFPRMQCLLTFVTSGHQ